MHVGTQSFCLTSGTLNVCEVASVISAKCHSSVSDRKTALEAALKLLQQFYLDLDKFLNWLTEAETTCNVLIDATNKERLPEQPAAKNLLAQWKVGPSHHAHGPPLPQYAAGFIVELAFLLKSVILMNNSKESHLKAKQKVYSCSLPLPLLCRKYEQSRAAE